MWSKVLRNSFVSPFTLFFRINALNRVLLGSTSVSFRKGEKLKRNECDFEKGSQVALIKNGFLLLLRNVTQWTHADYWQRHVALAMQLMCLSCGSIIFRFAVIHIPGIFTVKCLKCIRNSGFPFHCTLLFSVDVHGAVIAHSAFSKHINNFFFHSSSCSKTG